VRSGGPLRPSLSGYRDTSTGAARAAQPSVGPRLALTYGVHIAFPGRVDAPEPRPLSLPGKFVAKHNARHPCGGIGFHYAPWSRFSIPSSGSASAGA